MPQYQGVWTLPVAARLQSNQQWATDPLYRNTTLLLQADNAPNGAQNNTFIDSSSNNFTITRNGNTTQGTFTPFSQSPGWWSNYFNGSSDYLRIADNTGFDFGTGAFCIELWFMLTADAAQNGETNREATLLAAFPDSGTLANTYAIGIGGNSSTTGTAIAFSIRQGDTIAYNQVYTAPITKNEWHHVAVCRSGNNFAMFYDGLRVSSNASYTYSVDTAHSVKIGALIYPTYNHYFPGYISNVRIVKGASVYTPTNTSIVVPNIPLGATSGGQTPPTGTQTSLLTCQSNRFVDNGGLVTPNTITIGGGTPSVQAFSPFAPQYQWTAPVIGGSAYFDGTGDYLSVPASAQFLPGANTDFTFEAWVYLTATPSAQGAQVVGTGEYGLNSDWGIAINSSRVPFFYFNVAPSGFFLTSSTAVNLNSWNHIAVTRSGTGANNLKMFLNGVNVSQASRNDTMDYNGNNLSIGADENGDEAVFTGYISGLRLINGTGYTSISVPTAPPTAITNTVLLTNFTNAGIVDGTMKNNLETVGNAQISTSVVKYGTGSMAFDGTGDYLSLPVQRTIELGSSDWTFETWVYMNAVSSQQSIIYLNGNTSGYAALNLQVQSGALNLWLSANGSSWSLQQNTIGAIAANAWNHIAVVKVGTNIKVYINGTNVSGNGYTVAASLMTTYTLNQIGVYNTSSYNLNGYLDDMRLTLGVARYTANFTPPTVALPRQ